VNDYSALVTHVARDGGYLDIHPRRTFPSEWKGTCHLEGAVHTVIGDSVDDVIHQLADRTGAI